MIQIAICDDDNEPVEKISQIVNEFFINRNVKVNVELFSDGRNMLACNKKFNLIFLDIEMKGLNGIEIARRIRVYDLSVRIVYVTSYSKYWRSAYQVHAFDFIEKPVKEARLNEVLADYMRSIDEKEQRMVSLNIENGVILQDMDEIYYFMINKKKRILVKTRLKEYIARENLTDIYEKLDKNQFYIPHRSSIVNLKYVDHIERCDIYLENGEWIPLAQKKRKEFLIKINEFACQNGKGK